MPNINEHIELEKLISILDFSKMKYQIFVSDIKTKNPDEIQNQKNTLNQYILWKSLNLVRRICETGDTVIPKWKNSDFTRTWLNLEVYGDTNVPFVVY